MSLVLLLVLYEDKSTTWQAKQLGAYYILLQTCNQLEEHFFGIEVAGCRSNLVCANVWSYCPSRRSKMNLLRLHHKHQRLFCGLERALRLDARRIPSSADVLLNVEDSIASGCHLPLLSLQLFLQCWEQITRAIHGQCSVDWPDIQNLWVVILIYPMALWCVAAMLQPVKSRGLYYVVWVVGLTCIWFCFSSEELSCTILYISPSLSAVKEFA